MEADINFEKIIKETFESLGQVNIVIAGKTGVGKSTLLNAVFGEDMAETGVGRPITQTMKEYSKEGELYHLIDTKGFELNSYQQMKNDLLEEISRRKGSDPSKHIHILWYCVSEEGARIEPAEIEFIQDIKQEIPVILVFTKAFGINLDFFNKVKEEYYHVIDNAVRVLALEVETAIGIIPAHGIDKLAEATYELLPEAAKKAFVAAQQANRALKKKSTQKIIYGAAAAATTAGATPIPFSDAFVLAPIQIGMIACISVTFGLNIEASFISTIVTAAAGVTGATYAGRAIVSGLIKCIPGAGSLVGGVISAATAGTLTTAMGWAYYKALVYLEENNIELTPQNIASTFKEQLKLSKS